MENIDTVFSRNLLFFSKEKLDVVNSSCIAVAGVGGLGCVVAEILVRLGVRELVLVDNGFVDEPDLGRQLLYDTEDLGRKKVDAAKEKLLKATGFSNIKTFFSDIRTDNLLEIFKDADGAADCLDNYESRFILENYAPENKFIVHGGVENDFGQITTIIKDKTPSIADIYSGIRMKKAEIAVSTVSVFAIGSLMAQEIVNNILGKPELLNKMLIVELSDFSFYKVELSK